MKSGIKEAAGKMLVAVMLILSLTTAIAIRAEADLQDDYVNDLNYVVWYDSEGNVLHKSVAFAAIGFFAPSTEVYSQSFEAPEGAEAYYETKERKYKLHDMISDFLSAEYNFGFIDYSPDYNDEGILSLHRESLRQGDSVYMVYANNEEQTVVLTEALPISIDDEGRIAGIPLPKNAIYPVVLVDENNEYVGWMGEDGIVRSAIHVNRTEEDESEEVAEWEDALNERETATENAAADPGAGASADYSAYISLAAMCDSEGNLIHIGPAFAMRGNGVKVYTESFGDEVASAFLTTEEGSYDLDLDTVQVIDGVAAIWDLKEPAPEEDIAFLDVAYPHQSEEAIIVYYAWENEKMNIHAETVILEDCDENGILTVDHFPENMMYPAVLVNRDGAFVGLVSEDEKIICGVDQEIFYGSSLSANDLPQQMTEESAGSMPEVDGTEKSFDYKEDLNAFAMYNSAGERINVSVAIAMNTEPVKVITEPYDESGATAHFVTKKRFYELDVTSMNNYENGVAFWTLKDPLPEDDAAFLDVAYAHQFEEATMVYFAMINENIEVCTEAVTLTDCNEYQILTVDHYPEEESMMYPAIVVNADNAIIGIVDESKRIVGMTSQETFYGYGQAAENAGAEDAVQEEPEASAAIPAVIGAPEEAVNPALMVNADGNYVKTVNTSAVQLDGNVYVLTAYDAIKDFDDQIQFLNIYPEDLPDNLDVNIALLPVILSKAGVTFHTKDYVSKENDLPIVAIYGMTPPDNPIEGLPLANAINPEHRLGYAFSYVVGDDSGTLYNQTEQQYIMNYSPLGNDLYLIGDEIAPEVKDIWPGALIYDMATNEAVGIGTFYNGQYAFEDITTVLRTYLEDDGNSVVKNIFPVNAWGSLAGE